MFYNVFVCQKSEYYLKECRNLAYSKAEPHPPQLLACIQGSGTQAWLINHCILVLQFYICLFFPRFIFILLKSSRQLALMTE